MKRIERACRHCGVMIEFENFDEPTDCPGCKKPWQINEAGMLVKLYRPPDKRKKRPWMGGR